jgi:hypothetical protein
MHTHMHACIHTHIHKHTHMQMQADTRDDYAILDEPAPGTAGEGEDAHVDIRVIFHDGRRQQRRFRSVFSVCVCVCVCVYGIFMCVFGVRLH